MNRKKKIGLIALAMIAVFICIVAVISILLPINEETMQKVPLLTKEALMINGSTTSGTVATKGAHDSSSFYQNGSFYYESSASTLNKVFIPTIGDIQLYCVQKGVHFEYEKDLVALIRALHGQTGTSTSGSHMAPLPEKRYSNTYYICVNNHTEMKPSGAYIITTPNNILAPYNGSYSYGVTSSFSKGENISKEVRQVAMWLNPEMNQGESFAASGASFSYLDMVEQLKNEALDYRDYEANLKAHADSPLKETTSQEVKIDVNQDEQYYVVGPFKMDYVEGNSSTAKFAGISNMVVKGYNDEDKQKFIKDIEIINYRQNGIEKELKFFNPKKEDGYVDREDHSYPASGQEFYIKIKNPNLGVTDVDQKVRYFDVNVEYSYMTIYAIQCELEGHQLVATAIKTGHSDSYNRHGHLTSCRVNYRWNVTDCPLPQQKMIDAWGERNLYKLNINLTGVPIDEPPSDEPPSDEPPSEEPPSEEPPEEPKLIMKLGGYVWEDTTNGKENIADGIHSGIYRGEENDRVLPNVKVTLYECETDRNGRVIYEDGKPLAHVVDLLSEADLIELTREEIHDRVNPKLTDEDGYYQFDGLDPENKYYVTLKYNGQTYLPTEYLVTGKEEKEDGTKFIHENSVSDMVFNANLYNTDIWEITSKGTEDVDVRDSYNNKFAEIGSSPKNYVSSNSLQTNLLIQDGRKYYNEIYSVNDLMGYELQEDGSYSKQGIQLIDEFYDINNDGNIIETNKIVEGEISRKIQEYISNYNQYPEDDELINLYESIVNENARNEKEREILWKKLQYIEDCKINAYTGSPFENGELDLYPVYDDFVIDTESMVIPGEGTKPPIYNGQFYVNLGLWRRAKNDLALKKDLYRAAIKINGKTEVYNYDKRSEEENGYWEIQLRMRDYDTYYSGNYNRELYIADYNYKSAITNLYGSDLEVYVTYKITLRNTSQQILNEVTEVVDYYDKDYTYVPELSWVMYKDSVEEGNEKVAVSKNSYYNMMHNLKLSEIKNARDVASSYSETEERNGLCNGNSMYGEETQNNVEQEYNSVYVRGLENKKLVSGESAYIYLTFKVKSDEKGPVILDDDNILKQNYAEINGYRNYYSDGTKLPNEVVIRGNDTPAGIIDYDSTPGNLQLEELEGNRYEKNFEDDTDRAKSLKLTLSDEDARKMNGIAWEDQRTQTVNGAVIGDGVRQDDEMKVQGITVELVEKIANGSEYIWQTTKTDANGKYEFTGYIPGDYIVRFKYGDTVETVLTAKDGSQNAVSYNGQDFKTTVYQQDLKNDKGISDYTEKYYNIEEADKLSVNGKTNVSDAKDLWENKTISTGRTTNNQTTYKDETFKGRTQVNEYSSKNVNNYKAEVLASPYAQVKSDSMIQELINNTNMSAETAIIVAEVEYNRTYTDGYNTKSNGSDLYLNGNDYNGEYVFKDVDIGLTERPKAQLELGQKVTNVKIALANGNVLFDAIKSVDNLVWLEGQPYNLDSKMQKNQYEAYYKESLTDKNYHRYSYRAEVDKLVTGRYNSTGSNGLIQAIMDEEIMHGAVIEITYKLNVKNVGETDFTGKDFYYKAKGSSDASKVTTTPNIVINYVANNLQSNAIANKDWSVVTKTDLISSDQSKIEQNLVNSSLEESLNSYNVILQTSKMDKNLKPGESVEKDLYLSQTITSQNSSDDLRYSNFAEIVQTSNTVGRRMAYSIVGNQDPTQIPAEVDSAKAEDVTILPPFGASPFYYGVAIVVALIIVAGAILIQKKAMKQ